MKKEVITTAKTIDEAIALAVEELNAPSADKIEYTVIEEPKKGLFGIGATNAKISASYIAVCHGNFSIDIHVGNKLFDLVHGHGTLLACLNNACLDLKGVKGLTGARLLYNQNRCGFDRFVGSEALTALFTFPSAPDRSTFFVKAAVDNLTVHTSTKHTFHNAYLLQ